MRVTNPYTQQKQRPAYRASSLFVPANNLTLVSVCYSVMLCNCGGSERMGLWMNDTHNVRIDVACTSTTRSRLQLRIRVLVSTLATSERIEDDKAEEGD